MTNQLPRWARLPPDLGVVQRLAAGSRNYRLDLFESGACGFALALIRARPRVSAHREVSVGALQKRVRPTGGDV